MSRAPFGFIKTARRGSAYSTQNGRYFIVKVADRSWHLVQMRDEFDGRDRALLGRFSTLRDAAEFYRTTIAAP